ncbi:acyltransferase-like protein, chloroplastic, partial [Tanacetum coccineum]
GESIGGCLALAAAARTPHIDLVLVLANPGEEVITAIHSTSFGKSRLQPLVPIFKMIPEHFRPGLPYLMSLLTGVPSRMVTSAAEKGLTSQHKLTNLSETAASLFSYLSDIGEVLTVEMVLWKLKMLEAGCAYSNSGLHSVSAQTLILSSGNDQILPSLEEGERLGKILPKCQIRKFTDCGHLLFLEENFDPVTVIKGAGYYRRGKHTDYASDFLPPSSQEMKDIVDSAKWLDDVTSSVMLSTLESEDLAPMIRRFIIERNIIIRGVAYPMLFKQLTEGQMPYLATYDVTRLMGAVPVSASNLYKLFSMKSHVLLYLGGVCEALHRKGKEYTLFWPKQYEFVRMATRFGATIIPFGAVGEDDYA